MTRKSGHRFSSRQTRNAFARRSCSNKNIERDDDSKKSHPALARVLRRRVRGRDGVHEPQRGKHDEHRKQMELAGRHVDEVREPIERKTSDPQDQHRGEGDEDSVEADPRVPATSTCKAITMVTTAAIIVAR